MPWHAIRKPIAVTAVCSTILIAPPTPTRAQVSISPQLVGVWNHLKTGHSIDVRETGDVWSTGKGLARASSTIAQGGNFAFEGQNPDGSRWRCIYFVTFLDDKLHANWRSVTGPRGNCPDGLYARVAATEAAAINDCDRDAASPFDLTRPLGVAGVPMDQIDAAKAIRTCQAVLQGRPNHPRTLYQLGRAHERAGDATSLAEAVRLYRKAAEAGHASAMSNLGSMYERGRGGAKDAREAARWYRRAADAGNESAMVNLGLMCRDGRGVANDDAEAVRLFRSAADAGNHFAMLNLGLMYADGRGVSRDDAEAVRWFRKAADAGYAPAMTNLGLMYRDGRGVPQHGREAANLFRRAAEAGHTAAMGHLGFMYETGRGVQSDKQEALRWYRRGADAGDAYSKDRLSKIGR